MTSTTEAPRVWSPQQQHIFSVVPKGDRNYIVEAVAGSGKTTTLVELVRLLRGRIAFLAYNKAIASDIAAKVQDIPNCNAGTFHAMGNAAWRKFSNGAKLDTSKLFNLCKAESDMSATYTKFVMAAVSLAKQWGIGALTRIDDMQVWYDLVNRFDLEGKFAKKSEEGEELDMDTLIETGITWSITVLKKSIAQAMQIIDFDDMIYMPVLRGCDIDKYDWVLVDEAQDTNPVRLAMAAMMVKPNGGRLVAVGDPRQAIYGFSGADSESLNKIADKFNAVRVPLTVTYRCPKAVVKHAQQWVSHIQAADTAPEGEVREMRAEDFMCLTGNLKATDAILCRLTKPLVSLAFSLIKKRVACHVEGRNIGEGLIALSKRWKVKTVGGLRTKLAAYMARETAKCMAKNQELKAQQIEDQVSTLFVIMDTLQDSDSLSAVEASINSLFSDTDEGKPAKTLTLCTVHRSKGREWNRVYLWDRPAYMPSRFARQAWQMEQEENLIYVAVTRAKAELIEVNGTNAL